MSVLAADDSTMKSYRLHTAENRKAVFARLSPRVWLEKDLLRTWVVADPAVVLKLLRHPMAVIASRAGILDVIADKYGMDFPGVSYACRVLPVLAEDDAHATVRKGFATFLAGRLLDLEPLLAGFSRSSLEPFGRKGQIDIVSEVVDPFVHEVVSVLLQTDVPAEILSLNMADAVFFNTAIARLRTLDSRIAKALSFLRATSGDENEVAWKFTCLVFGVDSLAGTLIESVVTALRDLDHRQPAGAKLPGFPVESGVPVTLRMAKSDFEIDGHEFKAGDVIRLQLQSFGYSEIAEDRQFIFGAGAHSCVGKQISLRVWQSFKREFDALQVKARIIDCRLVPSHFLMLHQSVQVEVL